MSRVVTALLLAICFVLSVFAPLRWLWALVVNPDRAVEILKGYDLQGNTLLNGTAGEYISTRAYVASLKGARWARVLSWLLDQVEKDHCRKSYENELARAVALHAVARQALEARNKGANQRH